MRTTGWRVAKAEMVLCPSAIRLMPLNNVGGIEGESTTGEDPCVCFYSMDLNFFA